MTDYIAEVTLEFEPSDNSFQINVMCTDEQDGTAINDASVSIHGPVEQTKQSDGGFAVFSGVPRGDYDIRGSIGGYQEATASVSSDDFVEQ